MRLSRLFYAPILVSLIVGCSSHPQLAPLPPSSFFGSSGDRVHYLWFTLLRTSKIGRISETGSIKIFRREMTQGARPREITSGPDGALWFTEAATDKIGRMTRTGTV